MIKGNDYSSLTPTKFMMYSANNDWDSSTTAPEFYTKINQTHSPATTNSSQSIPNAPPTPPQQNEPSPYYKSKDDHEYLLEKNRQAAYRCRQKKKKWVQGLEERYECSEKRNRELSEQISQLREESIYLRNLLLTHGNCDCQVVQDYLRHTSVQLSNSTSMVHSDLGSRPYNPTLQSFI